MDMDRYMQKALRDLDVDAEVKLKRTSWTGRGN